MNTLKTLIFLLISVLPLTAKADFCFRSFENDTAVAKAIFVGKVVQIESDQFWNNGRLCDIFTFEIIQSFKGINQWVGYISLIGPIHGCCNEHFVQDSTFLVFAYGDCDNTSLLWTNDCSNTGLLSKEKENYEKLGKSIYHRKDPDLAKFLNTDHLKINVLQNKIKHLNLNIHSTKATILSLQYFLVALLLVISVMGIILFRLIRKKNIGNL